jgi:hypothetical protein
MYKNEHFTKTGSGQTQGKLKKGDRFSSGAALAQMEQLEGLYLSDCGQMGNAGAKALAAGRGHLGREDAAGEQQQLYGERGMQRTSAAASGLSLSASLRTIDLCRCNIRDDGALALAHALRTNR